MIASRLHGPGRRRGATAVEAAIVIPVFLMFAIGTWLIGLGIYRYETVATLAREGARYASVHGSQYATDVNGGTAMTASQIYTNAIVPLSGGLDLGNLSYQIQWGTKASGSWAWSSWDSSRKDPTSLVTSSTSGQSVYNSVRVTVTYTWTPGMYMPGTLTLTSQSEMPMSY